MVLSSFTAIVTTRITPQERMSIHTMPPTGRYQVILQQVLRSQIPMLLINLLNWDGCVVLMVPLQVQKVSMLVEIMQPSTSP